jgi:hypothetical protein
MAVYCHSKRCHHRGLINLYKVALRARPANAVRRPEMELRCSRWRRRDRHQPTDQAARQGARVVAIIGQKLA